MSVEDASQSRQVMREIGKRQIDTSLLDVHVNHGIVYLRGVVKKSRGSNIDLAGEMIIVCRILRQHQGIRDVINEVTFR